MRVVFPTLSCHLANERVMGWRGRALEGEKGLMAPLQSGSGTELIGNYLCSRLDKRRGSVGVIRYYYHHHHHVKKDRQAAPDANTQSTGTALSASCPLLCLAHVASRRTPYAAKHWHSGTACRLLWVMWAVQCLLAVLLLSGVSYTSIFTCHARVLPFSGSAGATCRQSFLEESLLALMRRRRRRHTLLYPCPIPKSKRSKTISHSISCT